MIPWIIADSNYVIPTSQKLDPNKTVFVGALHGKLTADGLAKIMNDLFDGVVYAGKSLISIVYDCALCLKRKICPKIKKLSITLAKALTRTSTSIRLDRVE